MIIGVSLFVCVSILFLVVLRMKCKCLECQWHRQFRLNLRHNRSTVARYRRQRRKVPEGALKELVEADDV